ncbi:hypothetical protein EDD86DRAFT_249143 [Gorgonomyces haynaldii]|nr:hypothetical protein EDD86DRAFT_249143 [Gorgonomyces haynaldii]
MNLPNELWIEIFKHCPLELEKLSLVSRRFNLLSTCIPLEITLNYHPHNTFKSFHTLTSNHLEPVIVAKRRVLVKHGTFSCIYPDIIPTSIKYERVVVFDAHSVILGIPDCDILELHLQGRVVFTDLHYKRLVLESIGRFQHLEESYKTRWLEPIRQSKIQEIIFNGPFFQDIMDDQLLFYEFLMSLDVQALVADFDCRKLGLDRLISLLRKPGLRHVGRLGRFTTDLYKKVPKFGCPHIQRLELGTTKYPYSHKLYHATWLDQMGLGVLWLFPNLEHLDVHLGFQKVDVEHLLQMVIRIKQGLEKKSTIRKICFYQTTDMNLIDDPRWQFTATKVPLEAHPVEIHVTEDAMLPHKKGQYKYFGPPKTIPVDWI